ncbi:Obg family GTPase CgtA [Ruminococcus champanellensis]|uniref:Obg family GTPase CgtA n=1 Tax=Ruminococcus champanellensis TaxID=1161942 RepID=UPI0023F2527D|nr:Obg family GTPase CgtA [Ruminococcus champanellensis]
MERCRLILHVLDVSGVEGRDPIEDYKIINRELANFSEELAECPQIVAANKADMATEEQIQRLRTFIEGEGHHFFVISAATTQGTDALVQDVARVLETLPPIKAYEPEPLTGEELAARSSGDGKFEIQVEDGVYYVDAKWFEPILRTVDMDDYSSLQYFQRVLQNSGIIEKLEEMGIQEGDTVNILGFEFDYVK